MTDGETDEEAEVIDCATTTVWTPLALLPSNIASPPYVAVMVCAPTPRFDTTRVATPEPSRGALPNVVAPSENVIVPVARPFPGASTVTAALSVEASPNTVGSGALDSATVVVALATLKATAPEVAAGNVASPA